MNLVAAAEAVTFDAPYLDYVALAPEIILTATIILGIVVDVLLDERSKVWVTRLTGLGMLGSILPILYMAAEGITGEERVMFGGAYVVDSFALVLKAVLVVSGFVVVLLSTDYIAEGDYYEGEFAYMLASSLLGMVVMASARDLITIFVALELLSIPGYLLAGWRKRDPKSNEASLKYYLLGVLASALMLYGMSLVYGLTGSTILTRIGEVFSDPNADTALAGVGIFLVICGFAFKVSAVPFHLWAPDTYEGAPTPVTAFLSVASKTAGFIALLELVFVGFLGRDDVWKPIFWVFAALTMTVGNITALRQTNVIRMLAYSSVAQAGFMLVPFAVVERTQDLDVYVGGVVTYLLLYAGMNLGAFACVIAIARKTRSGEIASMGGLWTYAPGLATAFSICLVSLAGIPPLAGWYAKFAVIRSLFVDLSAWGAVLGVILAVNTVIAAGYYFGVVKEMFFAPVPEEVEPGPIRVPPALLGAVAICVIFTVVLGFIPGAVGELGDVARLFAG